jgi:hypothetical protein
VRTRPFPSPARDGYATAVRVPCECCRDDCTELIALTPDELDALVDLDRGHLLVPGHEDLRLERVVERRGRYVVTADPA